MAVKEPWWKGQVADVARELRRYLARRLPSRRQEYDDLVNETLLSLSQWMRRHEGTPHPWIAGPATDNDRSSFFAFARVILQRRVADRFRLDSREWERRVDLDEAALASIPSGAPSAERQFLLRRMLEITIGALSTLKAEDRDLIAFVAAGSPGPETLAPRERQRLSRARRKIVNAIVAELGAQAAELLRSDE